MMCITCIYNVYKQNIFWDQHSYLQYSSGSTFIPSIQLNLSQTYIAGSCALGVTHSISTSIDFMEEMLRYGDNNIYILNIYMVYTTQTGRSSLVLATLAHSEIGEEASFDDSCLSQLGW